MKVAALLVAGVFVVLLEIPSGLTAACGCSCKKELPARKCGEDDCSYYKRIFPVASCSCENTVTRFYESVFYEYKGESKQTYIQRIDFIFNNVYRNLDCRFDEKRTVYLQKYYEYKYCKQGGESDEQFFERVLTKTSESECVYKIKVKLIRKYITSVDWSKVKIEEKTRKGFSLIKCVTKSVGVENKCGCNKEKKKEKEVKTCKCQKPCGCVNTGSTKKQKEKKNEEHKKNTEKIKKDEEQRCANKRKVEAQKAEHCKNVKTVEEKKREHEKNKKKIAEQKQEHCRNEQKVEKQKAEHCENVKKIEEQEKEHKKNEKKIAEQKEEHDRNVERVEAQKAQHCENVKIIEAREKEKRENVIKWTKANYCRKTSEDINTYYRRICTKTEQNIEEYLKRVTLIRSLFSDLDLWYSEDYLCETKEYYYHLYSQKKETREEYFKRLTKIKSYETEENYAKRVHLEHILFPTLPIWYEDIYYETYTKTFYTYYYKKQECETNDIYLVRVFKKIEGESEEYFWKRIKLIQKTFPDYKCWYEKEHLRKIDACKDVCEANNEDELKTQVENETQTNDSDKCRQAKFECLQTFFKSSKSSKSSESTCEEEVMYSSRKC